MLIRLKRQRPLLASDGTTKELIADLWDKKE